LAWEIAVFVVLLVAYNSVRALGGDDPAAAFAHARWVVLAQGALALEVEDATNRWLTAVPVAAVLACYLYALMHYALTPLVLWRSRRRGGWSYWRGYWALVVASGLALAVYAVYPVAPPRLMPDLGISDVMRDYSGYGWWGASASAPRGLGDATNQFAAMPSMHCGWALWCGIQMWQLGGRWWRPAGLVYPATMALIVVATGNHFVLDVVAGVGVVVLGYGVAEAARRVVRLHPRRSAHALRRRAPRPAPGIPSPVPARAEVSDGWPPSARCDPVRRPPQAPSRSATDTWSASSTATRRCSREG
jgi:hypothetical protein